MSGWSELVFGSMYCGKSEELLRRLKRAKIAGQKYQLFKPARDDRYEIDKVATHDSHEIRTNIECIVELHVKDDASDKENLLTELTKQLGGAMEAEVVQCSTSILDKIHPDTKVVGIDEVQFFDEGLIKVVNELKRRNLRVILAGLDMYASEKPFGTLIPYFACTSKYVDKLHAVCVDCGEDAYISYKLDGSDPSVIDVGSVGKYVALCENCVQDRKEKNGQNHNH